MRRAWPGQPRRERGAGVSPSGKVLEHTGHLAEISSIESLEVGGIRVSGSMCVVRGDTRSAHLPGPPAPERKPTGTGTRGRPPGPPGKTTAEPGVGLTITTTQRHRKRGGGEAGGTGGHGPPWVLIRMDAKGTVAYQNGAHAFRLGRELVKPHFFFIPS